MTTEARPACCEEPGHFDCWASESSSTNRSKDILLNKRILSIRNYTMWLARIIATRYASAMQVTSSLESLHTAELISRLSLIAYGGGLADGLTPTQWTVLHFFSRANDYSRTVSAFAEYNVTTRGTASQSIKTLVDNGYLTRTRSNTDGRSVRFDLTSKAETALAEDPLDFLVRALNECSDQDRKMLRTILEQLVSAVANLTGREVFGACRDCALLSTQNGRDRNCEQTDGLCELMNKSIPKKQLDSLCTSFQPAFEHD